jgi:hypothetical protein
MQICHFVSDSLQEMNSSWWRGGIPASAINRLTKHRMMLLSIGAWMKSSAQDIVNRSDLVIVERILVEEAVERSKFWSDRSKAVVIDIDDSYSLLQPQEISGNAASKFWTRGMVEVQYAGGFKHEKKLDVSPLEQFRRGLVNCRGITMPSRILAEDWQAYSRTWVVPNYIDAGRYLPHRKTDLTTPKEIVIGWGGSMSHKLSFERSGVAEALRRVIRKYKHVKFMLCGDQRIADIVKFPPDKLIYRPYVMYNEWPLLLKQFDIGIAPLQGRYDSSRSAIKSEEFSVMGIPFVGTGCPTYEAHQKAGIGLYIQDSEDFSPEAIEDRSRQWEWELSKIIENYPWHKKLAVDQLDLALEWSMDRRVGNVIDTYQEIVDAK